MGEVINLRRARKAKQRATEDASAAANRLAFGRTKAERLESSMRADLADRRLDGHRIKPDGDA